MAATFLTLNVGGQQFVTSMQTLTQEPSSRLALLARGALPGHLSGDTLLIDRDPTHFRKLLNYLRDGYCDVTPAERKELMQEARYFQVR
jgi:BTB/POZ domain